MKTLFQIIPILAFAATITFSSCNKEEPIAVIGPNPEDFQQLREAALQARTQTTTFQAEDGLNFLSESGAELNIAPGCLTDGTQAATGTVELAFVELYGRGNMLVTNKPTMGITESGALAPLVSGGEFFVEVAQDGEVLTPGCPMMLRVPSSLTGGGDPAMTLWEGQIDADGNIAWEEEKEDADGQGDRVFVEGEGDQAQYYVSFGDFGWTNVDRFINDPRPKTTLQVAVPDGYDADNSAVYLSYDGEPNTLAKLDTYDSATGYFSEHYGQIPVGLEMHVIFVTEEAGVFRYAIKGVTVAEDDTYSFSIEETTTGTEQNLVDAIDALP